MVDDGEQMREFDEILKALTWQGDGEDSKAVNVHNNDFPVLERTNTARGEKGKTEGALYPARKRNHMMDAHSEEHKNTESKVSEIERIKEEEKNESVRNKEEDKNESVRIKEGDKNWWDHPQDFNLTHQPGSGNREFSEGDIALRGPGRTLSPGKKVKINLPHLKLPEQLLRPDEKSMYDLRLLLNDHGFELVDRPTLAFFAIGNDVRAAANYFCEFYKLVSTTEMKFPSLTKVMQQTNGFIECCARHSDGTFGVYFNSAELDADTICAIYVVREKLCYLLNMVDLSMLRAGTTDVVNMRGLTWRIFAPFQLAQAVNYIAKCLPIRRRRVLFVDPNFYASVALKMITAMISTVITRVAWVVSSDEARSAFPAVLLPPSLTASSSYNPNFTRLSAVEQINFQFLID